MSFFTTDNAEEVLEDNLNVLEKESDLLKALAHPIRLAIVKGLIKEEGCNVSEMQGCLNIPQSTLSQHLAKLRKSGILSSKKNGLQRNYYVIDDQVKKIVKILSDLQLSL